MEGYYSHLPAFSLKWVAKTTRARGSKQTVQVQFAKNPSAAPASTLMITTRLYALSADQSDFRRGSRILGELLCCSTSTTSLSNYPEMAISRAQVKS